MTLPSDAAARKALPLATGVLDYFPDALVAVAEVSRVGNEQHNPGTPLHWDKSKSMDHADCIVRHLLERGSFDSDGLRHSAKTAWRALALLQIELEASAVGLIRRDDTPEEEYDDFQPFEMPEEPLPGIDPDSIRRVPYVSHHPWAGEVKVPAPEDKLPLHDQEDVLHVLNVPEDRREEVLRYLLERYS